LTGEEEEEEEKEEEAKQEFRPAMAFSTNGEIFAFWGLSVVTLVQHRSKMQTASHTPV
jgi:hypothetical protein